MTELALPPRPRSDRSELSEMQQVFLDCYILELGNPRVLFRLLLAAGKSEHVSNSLMTALLRSHDGQEYISARKAQLEKYFNASKNRSPTDESQSTESSLEEAQKIIYAKVSADLVQGINDGSISYKSSAIIEKFMQKALDYSSDKVVEAEPPRIYLPENCRNCRYRIACESEDVVDDCKWCKYRKSCNERGEVYDQKTQLEVPKDIS